MENDARQSGLAELRRRYPWPSERPKGDGECDGWFAGANKTALNFAIDKPAFDRSKWPCLILELGSFQGLSAKWFMEAASRPFSTNLICIDHWEGSSEHKRRADWKAKLANLHGTFLDNLWDFRDCVVPMKTTTLAGICELHALGIIPDLIYVDASHETPFVFADTDLALRLFPTAKILGDDWPHDSVREGVVKAARRCKYLTVHGSSCWEILVEGRNERPPFEPYLGDNDESLMYLQSCGILPAAGA